MEHRLIEGQPIRRVEHRLQVARLEPGRLEEDLRRLVRPPLAEVVGGLGLLAHGGIGPAKAPALDAVGKQQRLAGEGVAILRAQHQPEPLSHPAHAGVAVGDHRLAALLVGRIVIVGGHGGAVHIEEQAVDAAGLGQLAHAALGKRQGAARIEIDPLATKARLGLAVGLDDGAALADLRRQLGGEPAVVGAGRDGGIVGVIAAHQIALALGGSEGIALLQGRRPLRGAEPELAQSCLLQRLDHRQRQPLAPALLRHQLLTELALDPLLAQGQHLALGLRALLGRQRQLVGNQPVETRHDQRLLPGFWRLGGQRLLLLTIEALQPLRLLPELGLQRGPRLHILPIEQSIAPQVDMAGADQPPPGGNAGDLVGQRLPGPLALQPRPVAAGAGQPVIPHAQPHHHRRLLVEAAEFMAGAQLQPASLAAEAKPVVVGGLQDPAVGLLAGILAPER